MVFSDSFFLTNVLYSPGFSFNLVFIGKLTSYMNYFLKFTNSACEIQDSNTLRKIGSAKMRDGLYALENSYSSAVNSVIDVPANVWHLRLGHVSLEKLSLLHKIVSLHFHSKMY